MCSQNSHCFFNICVSWWGFPKKWSSRTQVVFGVARENWTHPFNLIWALNVNLLIHQMLGKSIAFLFRKQKLYKDSHFITVQNSSILFIYDHMCIWNHLTLSTLMHIDDNSKKSVGGLLQITHDKPQKHELLSVWNLYHWLTSSIRNAWG